MIDWTSPLVTTTDSIEVKCRVDGGRGLPTYVSGTSAAAAFVSGAAALLLADDPNQDYHSLRARILNGVDPLRLASDAERVASGGRLNIAGALGLPATPPVARVVAPAAGGGGAMCLALLPLGLRRIFSKRDAACRGAPGA